jgi:hypothetical protein
MKYLMPSAVHHPSLPLTNVSTIQACGVQRCEGFGARRISCKYAKCIGERRRAWARMRAASQEEERFYLIVQGSLQCSIQGSYVQYCNVIMCSSVDVYVQRRSLCVGVASHASFEKRQGAA